MAVSEIIKYTIPLETTTVEDQRRIPFVQGDKVAHIIQIDTGNTSLSATVTGGAVRADGTVVGLEGTVSAGVASISIPAAAYNVIGGLTIIIRFSTDDVIRTALVLRAMVASGDSGPVVESTTTYDSVAAVLAQAQAVLDSIPDDYSAMSEKLATMEIATETEAAAYLGGD